MITASALAKVALIMMSCTGEPTDREPNCGDEFAVESWVAANHVTAKEECEKYLRTDFDPNDYLYIPKGDYAAVRCE